MRNVHKIDTKVINLPVEQMKEDRGYKACPEPYITFANPEDGSISWQNDVFSVAFIADSADVVLIKNGVEIPASGVPLSFPNQPDAVGFMVVWQNILVAYGAGCYTLRADYVLDGFEFSLFYGSFDLMPYSVEASEATIRVLGQYNDLVKSYGINFKQSNFARSFRVKGNLSNEQPNTEHGNILKGNDRFKKYRNFGQISYDLETKPLPACQLDPLFEILYASNRLYISDFNSANFRQYRDVEVILHDDESITYGEQFGHGRQLLASFKQKDWLIESKYSGREGDETIFTSGLDFSALVCPTVCADGTVNVNQNDGTLISAVNVASGGTEDFDVPNNDISVNGDLEGQIQATESLDVQLFDDQSAPVTPTAVSLVSNVLEIEVPTGAPAGWQRPADWLAMPTVDPTDDTFVGLHAVHPSGQNFVAFRFQTDTGDYQVDWGDGTVTTHASNTNAEHEYDYATYDPTDSTLSSRGYKQAMIVVTPVSGVLTTCNFQQRFTTVPGQNLAYATGFLDCILSMPNANTGSSIIFGGAQVAHRYVERVQVLDIGSCTSFSETFRNCSSLQEVSLPDTSGVLGQSRMFSDCLSLQIVPLFDTSGIGSFFDFFINCVSLQEVPLYDTSNATSFLRMLRRCESLQSVPLFDTSNATDMREMFRDCQSLQTVPLFDTSNVTNMSNMLNGCLSIQEIPAFDTSNVTANFVGFAISCNSLNRTDIVFTTTIDIRFCQLSRDEIVNIFNNLLDRSATTSENIRIQGNWGVPALTPADIAIATNKNWTVTT